jgi:citronellol/citronellal dehydrogenase
MKLKDRVAIVTGSSRGIGRAVALRLAKEGCAVVVAAKSTEGSERLPGSIFDVAKEVEALGARALPVQCNVREADQIEAMVKQTIDKFGRVDYLVNNAGALWWHSVVETPPNRFDLVMDINVRATFLCIRACLPHMMAANYGHIVNMSPPVDMKWMPGKIAYFISKFGMTMIAEALAEELQDYNIAANALWPATIVESYASINFSMGDKSMWRKADILADATLAIFSRDPAQYRGNAVIDEVILREDGVTDFDPYSCVPGSNPPRILWDLANKIG